MSSEHPSQSVINDLIDLYSNHNFKQALTKIKNIEKNFPNDPTIKNIKGACFEGEEKLDEALKSYKEAISIDSENFKAYFNLAGVMHQLDRRDDAINSYKQSLKINSKFVEAHNNLGNLLREMNYLDEAKKSFQAAISLKPDYVEALFSLSLVFQELGLLDEEVECLKKVTILKPKFTNAFNNLGVALKALGKFNNAIQAFKSAIKIHPNFAEAHNNLGNTYKEIGKPEDAISCYEVAINSDEVYPIYYNNLGIVLTELQQFDRATLVFQSSLAINADHPDTHNNLGNLFKEQGKFDKASKCYKLALSIDPTYFDAHNNLGNVQRELNQIDDAIRSYENAIEINEFFPEAHNNLGSTLKDIKKYDDALTNYQKAIQLNPNYVECFNNFGVIFFELGELDKAINYYKKALAINPDYAYAWGNIGIVYFYKSDIENAIKFYKKAILLDPIMVEAHLNLGVCFKINSEFDDALKCYERVISINPDAEDFVWGSLLNTMMHLCFWDEVNNRTNEILNKIDNGELVMLPFEFMALTDDPIRLKKLTQTYVHKNFPRLDTLSKLERYPVHQKIRIGYFSADFRLHPVTTLTAQMYEMHDRSKFEVHAFSFGRDSNDEMNLRIREGVDYYHDVVDSSDKDIVLLSRSLEIDIAVDLGGFTEGSRTKIFAMSAAPIQLSYIGYLGTLGADYYDYLIADENIIPKENQKYYSEKIIYLPSFQVNDSEKPNIKQLERRDFGLDDEKFIFCCFNNTFKITPNVFDSWSRILSKVDDSLLMIYVENHSSRNNLLIEMKKRGIKTHRLIFADNLPRIEYLERNTVVDLFLDTFPYNAATTASDSLRMGLPVLTLSGDSFASRVGTSLLKALDMPELITQSQDEYESVAIDLASKPNKLNNIKKKLAKNLDNTLLFDTKEFTKQIERSYTEIYERYQLGSKPDHIYLNK